MIVLNYALNKFAPFIIIGFLAFYKIGFNSFEPYVILFFSMFIAHFNWRAGYSVAYCEKNNINLDD